MSQPDTTTLAGKIAVMQAALEGKAIQYRDQRGGDWCSADMRERDYGTTMWQWNWWQYDYRIKPQEPLRGFASRWDESAWGGFYGTEPNGPENDRYRAVPMIELTPEVEAALKSAGII